MADLAAYLGAARRSFTAGAAIPGPDAAGKYDDLAFALPANAGATLLPTKTTRNPCTIRRPRSLVGIRIMANAAQALRDDAARLAAISSHRRSLLVESGAGSGKTAVMAGRIAMMLAEGIAPRSIAAVTFTELAASELLSRVRGFVFDLLAGDIAVELRMVLLNGLSTTQQANLAKAAGAIDEITCSTIHGFCQRLIKPYPSEADIDPGAGIIDRTQGDLAFLEIVDAWLRDRLSGDRGSLLAEMVLHESEATVYLVHRIAQSLRRSRGLCAPPAPDLGPVSATFLRLVHNMAAFQRGAVAHEADTQIIVQRLRELVDALAAIPPATTQGLVALLKAQPSSELFTREGKFRKYKKKGKWVEAAKRAGLSKSDGERLNDEATGLYDACDIVWSGLQQAAASRALAILIDDTKPILERYREYKRRTAQLDFDDLIFAARDLLRDHDSVRRALGARFRHVSLMNSKTPILSSRDLLASVWRSSSTRSGLGEIPHPAGCTFPGRRS